ncbi:LysR family transcriptional regulator [Rhizobium sophorae]|uniref:HTH-type transcriptional regulator TtuA n=1 Tax=Rhizobium sophorae TaxID=1535242 RepID=A0A7Y3S4U7_9HYPH|nr:LysR family transcriptional regulator [Rhizobium sophorae]NNU36017.1 LysR family transcriptional regulator [Rhizobium sophorae]
MSFDSRLLSGIGVVVAVVEAGSFARAGEAMGLTQPAVSRAVARLEERVGIRIFNRTARAISLTDEGRRFYEAVAPLLAGIGEAAVSAGKSKAIVRGRLRVNVDGTFGHYVLAPRLGEFLDHYPELSVEISVRDAMGDLVAEGVDVAVRFGAPEPSSLKARLLLETHVLTCASPAYVARHGAPAHPEQLAQDHQCLLIRDPTTGRPFEWEFQRGKEVVPLAASGRLMVNDTGSLLGACLGGTGVAQLLEIYARDFIAQNRLVQLLPDWGDETFPLYAFHHSSNLVSAKVRAFLDFVRGLAS